MQPTSVMLTPLIKERLEYLCDKYHENRNQLIRRLINDAYATSKAYDNMHKEMKDNIESKL